MARPKKCRLVENFPQITIFKPSGIGMLDLEPAILGYEEIESIRLADYEGKKQEEAAKVMNVSRATFGRIVEKARFTVADALLNGKAIVIQGGDICCQHNQTMNANEELKQIFQEKQKKCLTCKKYLSMHGDEETISQIEK